MSPLAAPLQDDSQEMVGDHVTLSGGAQRRSPPSLPAARTRTPCSGYSRLVDGLATYSEVLLQREVVRIEHDARSVRVHTRGGGEGLDADAVLVTVRSHVTTRRRRTCTSC